MVRTRYTFTSGLKGIVHDVEVSQDRFPYGYFTAQLSIVEEGPRGTLGAPRQ